MKTIIENFSVIQTLQFAEWIALNYIRLNNCWVGMYKDQRNKDNWKDTGELFKYWIDNCQSTNPPSSVNGDEQP